MGKKAPEFWKFLKMDWKEGEYFKGHVYFTINLWVFDTCMSPKCCLSNDAHNSIFTLNLPGPDFGILARISWEAGRKILQRVGSNAFFFFSIISTKFSFLSTRPPFLYCSSLNSSSLVFWRAGGHHMPALIALAPPWDTPVLCFIKFSLSANFS